MDIAFVRAIERTGDLPGSKEMCAWNAAKTGIRQWQVPRLFSRQLLTFCQRPQLLDATRIEDGKVVYIKLTFTDDQEIKIAQLLYNESTRSDPRNHCVPILDVFQDNIDPTISYIVMPLLRRMNNPPFEYVEEVVEFIDQMLEVSCLFIVHSACLTVNRGLFLSMKRG